MTRALISFLIIIFSAFLVFLASFSYINHLKESINPSSQETKIFVIQKGESINSIAQRLEKENLIRSALIFRLTLKFSNQANQIQAGDFKLSQKMSMGEIIDAFAKGSKDKWVTVIEGLRLEEVAQVLSNELGFKNDEFLKVAKEGYMFPDTYLIAQNASAQDVASIMKANFDQKYTSALQSKVKNNGLTSDQGVILASIVEREARSAEARTAVASILLKRFKIGMVLNADATLQYALGYQKNENPPAGGWWKKTLEEDDLKVQSLYNTYLHGGLPPTPICNPSLSSLQAVANADPSTPYLYYYHDSKGNSHYGRTLEEHMKNVKDYP